MHFHMILLYCVLKETKPTLAEGLNETHWLFDLSGLVEWEEFSSVFKRWVTATDNDKMSMRDSTQTADYEKSQRKKAAWNVISGGTSSMDFDTGDDGQKVLSPSKVVFRKHF